MRNILLLFFILLSTAALSQSTGYLRYDTVRVQKIGGNSTLIIENATRNLDGAFLQNYSQGRTRFAHALDSVWVDGDSIRFRYGSSTIAVLAGSAIDTTSLSNRIDAKLGSVVAQNGLTNVNDSTVKLGGALTESTTISFDYGKKNFLMRVSPNGNYGDFDFTSIDTIQNPDNFGATNQVGLRSLKTFRFPSYSALTYHGGATLGVEYQIKDSAKINTFGQDFGFASRAYMQFTRMSGYTGKSVYEMGDLTMNDGVPIHLASTDFGGQSSTAGTNYKYVKGYVVGHTSYAFMNANDTIENFIGFNNMGFFPFPSHIKWSADYVGGYLGSTASTRVAKPWSLYMWNSRAKNYLKGNLYLGDSTITHHQLAIYGSTLANDSIYANYTLADSDSSTAVPNTAWVKRNIGSGGGSQTLQQVFDQEIGGSVLTKTDTIDLNGNYLKLIGSDGNFQFGSNGNAGFAGTNGGDNASFSMNPSLGFTLNSVIGSNNQYIDIGNGLVGINAQDGGGQSDFVIRPTGFDFEATTGTYKFTNIPDSTAATNYMMVWNSDDSSIRKAPLPAGASGASGISEVVAGFGLENVNDSTIQADSLVLVTHEKLYNVLDSLPEPNLLFDSLGTSGISPVTVRDDTLTARRMNGAEGTRVDTISDGSIRFYWRPRIDSTSSSATPTINTDNVDIFKITALATDITSFTTNLSGTPYDGQVLVIQITATATQSITWGASFASSTVDLPTETDGTNTLTVVLLYYSTSSYGNGKWTCANTY